MFCISVVYDFWECRCCKQKPPIYPLANDKIVKLVNKTTGTRRISEIFHNFPQNKLQFIVISRRRKKETKKPKTFALWTRKKFSLEILKLSAYCFLTSLLLCDEKDKNRKYSIWYVQGIEPDIFMYHDLFASKSWYWTIQIKLSYPTRFQIMQFKF
jgi:hypothetical protein